MSKDQVILLVDDDQDIIDQHQMVLEGEYTIETAFSGKEAKEKVAANKPTLIVMDVMMNGLSDGLDTAKELKEAEATKDIPIIMVTSVNEIYNYRDQVEEGYFPKDKWLDKPIKPDVLLAEVKALIK